MSNQLMPQNRERTIDALARDNNIIKSLFPYKKHISFLVVSLAIQKIKINAHKNGLVVVTKNEIQSLAVGQEGKLPLSTFGYPYQQLVTILTKKTEAGIFKTFIAIAFKKISYPLSTISYPLLASYSTGYTSSVTGYTYPQLATLFNFKGAFLAILGNNHNQKKCLHSKGLYQKLINQFLTGYTSSVTGYTSSVTGYTYPQLATLHPQLATLLSAIGYTSSAIGYTCYSKTPTTMGKTYFLLKLLKTLYKNRLKVRGCYE